MVSAYDYVCEKDVIYCDRVHKCTGEKVAAIDRIAAGIQLQALNHGRANDHCAAQQQALGKVSKPNFSKATFSRPLYRQCISST